MLTEDQLEALSHLGYEWWMFRSCHKLLGTTSLTKHDPVWNALLESLVIHGRGISYFFCQKKSKNTDWNVTDFGLPLTPWPDELKNWRDEANTRVAHITTLRKSLLSEWNIDAVSLKLETEIKKLKAALVNDFPQSWMGDKQAGSTHFFSMSLLSPSTAQPTVLDKKPIDTIDLNELKKRKKQ